MRPKLPIGIAVVAATVAANAGRDGYLAVVGPKPVVFARPSVPLAVAIARLPALAKETPDPRSLYGSGTNDSVLMAPSGSPTNSVAKGPKGTNGANGDTHVKTEAGSPAPGNGGTEGHPATGPGPGDPTTEVQPGGDPNAFPGVPRYPLDPRGALGPGNQALDLLSLQMLLQYFQKPAQTNGGGGILIPIPFTPGQPPLLPTQTAPRPAASSTATYEQH